MPLSPAIIENFGGLDLLRDPGEVAADGSIDLCNVDFDRLGRVRSRNGFVNFTTAEGVNAYDSLFAFSIDGSADTILAGNGPRVDAIVDAAVGSTVTGSTSDYRYSFTAYGTATENRVYLANGVDTVRYYTSSGGFTTPSYTGTTPKGAFLGVQQPDNRLVVANQPDHHSRVMFSDPGDPSTFGDNNYVDLSPGDGEQITALVGWREFLFAFKETKFYVFYGNSVDSSTGDPIFNVRSVPGAGVTRPGTVAAGQNGVFFLDRRGIYASSGGQPQLLSRVVDPLFDPVSGGSEDQLGASGFPTLSWADDRLYLCYAAQGSTTNNRVLVGHTTDGWWSLWKLAAGSVTLARTLASSSTKSLLFGRASGLKHIGKLTDAGTDDGDQIDSYYQTGFMDFGDPSRKVLRETLIDGSGQIQVGYGLDYAAVGDLTTVTLGTASLVGQGRLHRAFRGRNFSVRLESVDGSSWIVNRLVGNMRSKNPPGIGGK